LALILATLAVYWQVFGFGFAGLDDTAYVANNPHVLGGLTSRSAAWAFQTTYQSNWHPLTWISLMADAKIGGGGAAAFHVTNVALHILNTILLFVFLRLATGHRWRSGAVALLFAIHPLHVESVAWITERKDVLSTAFWLLTMLAYLWYARRRSVWRYLVVVLSFALGLMAKPMLVTLPFVLLLMDIWPLDRVKADVKGWWRRWSPLALEKTPMFVLAAASCVVTFRVQQHSGAVADFQFLSPGVRIANALVAYVSYITKMFWPLRLTVLYAHPGRTLPMSAVVGSALALVLATAVAITLTRKKPYVAVGWLWYVLTLVPVIGLVQVGSQGMADRYTYVPLIGLFVLLAWGVPDLVGRRYSQVSRRPVVALSALGALIAVALSVAAYVQVGYWRDVTSLAKHAVEAYPESFTAHYLRAGAYSDRGDFRSAVEEYRKSLALNPNWGFVHFGLAVSLSRLGQLPASAEEFKRTLKMIPLSPDVHYEAGGLLLKMGQWDRAIKHYRYALALGCGYANCYTEMGYAYARKRDFDNARKCFVDALQVDPNQEQAREYLAWTDAQLAGGRQ